MDTYRVLCLHGYRQNGVKLRGRIAAFRRAMKSSMEFVCVDAPLVVPYEPTTEEHTNSVEDANDVDVQQFSWWNFQIDEETGKHKYSHVDKSIEYLAEICRKDGPFDGVFGFSQGGMMASLLLQHQQENPGNTPFNFSFGIFVAAARSGDPRYLSDSLLNFPSLHIMGETDAVVTIDRSEALAKAFVDPIVLRHTGGHYIPTNKDPKDALRNFIKQLKTVQR